MVKFFIKLNDSDLSFEISAMRGKEILASEKGVYDRDLDDKIIKGLDKILGYVRLKKQEKIKSYFVSKSSSFVSNLIVNSAVNSFNWLEKYN